MNRKKHYNPISLIVKSDNIEVNNVCPSKDTTIEMKMQSKK
jgi:hypothetical protein